MLFKLFNKENKFIQYISICITSDDINNTHNNGINIKVIQTLSKHTDPKIAKVYTTSNVGGKSQGLHIYCYNDMFWSHSYYLSELVSSSRRSEFDKFNNAAYLPAYLDGYAISTQNNSGSWTSYGPYSLNATYTGNAYYTGNTTSNYIMIDYSTYNYASLNYAYNGRARR